MSPWIGIDVSKDELAVCVLDEQRQVSNATFANDRKGVRSLGHYLQKRVAAGSAACLEATGSYGEVVAAYLYEQGYRVSVVNPVRIKRFENVSIIRFCSITLTQILDLFAGKVKIIDLAHNFSVLFHRNRCYMPSLYSSMLCRSGNSRVLS